MVRHERSAHLEHFRIGRAFFEDLQELSWLQTAFRCEHKRFGQRGGVEPDKEIGCELRQRSHTDSTHIDRLLCNRVENRLTAIRLLALARDKDRTVAALDHCARSAHRRIQKSEPFGCGGCAETTRQLRGNRAHLDQRAIERRCSDQSSRADDGFLDALKRRQNYEYGVRIYRDFSNTPGGDQSLSPKSLNLLSARIVAFHFELRSEKTRGNCAAEKAETDDADAFHETSVVKKALNHNFFLLLCERRW